MELKIPFKLRVKYLNLNEDHFKGKVTIKIGPVPAKFNGDVEFSKRDNLTYELSMEGK